MSTDALALPGGETLSRPFVDALHEWVATVDHKRLGILYILYALLFLVIGGIEAGIMRIQLIRAHNDFLCRDAAGIRIRKLPYPSDDWRAGHGVSAAKRFQFLAHGIWRAAALF